MRFTETKLSGAWLIEPEPFEDERGFFARVFCFDEFSAHGLETSFVQHSMSGNANTGTLRGMHYQKAPHEEVKLVGCTNGAIYDVIIDLRHGSPTYKQWQGFELTSENKNRLYVPKGFAHGFQTLADDTHVFYLISAFFTPEASTGVAHDDAAFGISWPLPITTISEKDQNWPAFTT